MGRWGEAYGDNYGWGAGYLVGDVGVEGHAAGVGAPVADLLEGGIGPQEKR